MVEVSTQQADEALKNGAKNVTEDDLQRLLGDVERKGGGLLSDVETLPHADSTVSRM